MMATITRLLERRRKRKDQRTARRKERREAATLLVLPPRVIADLSDTAYAELRRIATRDGITPGAAATRLIEECLVDDADGSQPVAA